MLLHMSSGVVRVSTYFLAGTFHGLTKSFEGFVPDGMWYVAAEPSASALLVHTEHNTKL